MGDIEKIDLSNFCETSEEEGEINEIKDAEKKNWTIQRNSFSNTYRWLMQYYLW